MFLARSSQSNNDNAPQQTQDTKIMSLLRQNDITMSFCRNNDIIIASYVRWLYAIWNDTGQGRWRTKQAFKGFSSCPPHYSCLFSLEGHLCYIIPYKACYVSDTSNLAILDCDIKA